MTGVLKAFTKRTSHERIGMYILPYSHCHIANQRTLDYGLGGEHVYIFRGKMRTITKMH